MKNAKTNEQLAVEAKTGDAAAIEQLWLQVRSYAAWMANSFIKKYSDNGQSVCGQEFDDLLDESYFAMLKAVEQFEPAKGFLFTTYFHKHIQNATGDLCGYRGGRKVQTLDRCTSLDLPIGEGENTTSLLNVIEDPHSADGYNEADAEILYSQLCDVMVELLQQLPDQQRKVITMRYLQGKTYMQICDALNMKYHTLRTTESKAMRNLRAPKNAKRLQEIETELDDLTDFYRTGCHDFIVDGERIIEKHVLRRDRLRKQKMRDCP